MSNPNRVQASSEIVSEFREEVPIFFRLGLIWARYAPRGKGAVPRMLNRLDRSDSKFYFLTSSRAKLACWLGAADTYTGIAARGGVYEPFILDVIKKVLKQGETFYDIGGNVGIMSIETAQAFSGAVNIFCFEPQYELARHIAISAELNHFDSLAVFNCLLDDSNGEQFLHVPAHSIHASLVPREPSVRVEKRATYCLDDLVNEKRIDPPDVIKIDVEGAEMRVFNGARQTISRYQPSIIFEADSNMKRFGHGGKDLMAFLSECVNYRYFLIKDHGSIASLEPIDYLDKLPENANILARSGLR